MVESAMRLPPEITGANPVELMRGSVRNGAPGQMVSASLAKASFLLCLRFGFSHVIVTCREPVDLMYRAYQFDDLLAGDMIDLSYSPCVKHKVLCLPIGAAAERWKTANPPLFEFMFNSHHPDIDLDHAAVRQQFDELLAGSDRQSEPI
jgi:hypothetical protein